jgi:tetratricopeptide (TPR) repeat protein
MLETVRQFARDRLEASGEGAAARTRHLEFFTAFMVSGGPKLVGPEQGDVMRRIDGEIEELLAAHAWCDRLPDGATRGLRLINDLPLYWTDRGLLELGLRVFREALARPGGDPALRTVVLSSAGRLAFRAARYNEAAAFAGESLALARTHGDGERATWALHLLGAIDFSRGALEGARGHYEEGLALAREQGNQRALADIYNALAIIRHVQGELDQAVPLYQQALAIKRQLGNVRDIGIVLLNVAQLEIQRGGHDAARRTARESLDYVERSGSKLGARTLLETAAALASAAGDHERSARYFGAAHAMMGWTGAPRDPEDDQIMRPVFQRTRDALGPPAFAAAYAGGQSLGFESGLAEVRPWLEADSP